MIPRFNREQILTAIDKDTSAGNQYSSALSLEGAKRVSFVLQRSGHTSGNSVFTVEASYDGVNWVVCNNIVDNVANANTENIARVASKQVTTNGYYFLALDTEYFCFPYIRGKVTVTTDGSSNLFVITEV